MHAPPWKFVDRVLERSSHHARAEKLLSADEPLGCGPLFVVEALAQTAAEVGRGDLGEHRGYLTAISNFRFSSLGKPGDRIELCVTRTQQLGALHRFSAEARIDGHTVAAGELTFALYRP